MRIVVARWRCSSSARLDEVGGPGLGARPGVRARVSTPSATVRHPAGEGSGVGSTLYELRPCCTSLQSGPGRQLHRGVPTMSTASAATTMRHALLPCALCTDRWCRLESRPASSTPRAVKSSLACGSTLPSSNPPLQPGILVVNAEEDHVPRCHPKDSLILAARISTLECFRSTTCRAHPCSRWPRNRRT